MLPPGIFVWKSGDETISPGSPGSVAAASAGWERDMASFGPWEGCVESSGHAFDRSGQGVDETIVVVRRCETTMSAARLLAEENVIGEWGSVVAVEQSIGRGQLRRPWVSSPGNLHASLIMPTVPESGEWGSLCRISFLLWRGMSL